MRTAEILAQAWLKERTDEQVIDLLCRVALLQGLPVALWRSPGEEARHLLIDLSGEATPVHPEVEVLPSGFLFSPYEADFTSPEAREKKQSLLLKAHLHYTTGEGVQLQFSSELSSSLMMKAENLLDRAAEFSADEKAPLPYFSGKDFRVNITSAEHYQRLVASAIKEIQEGKVQKLVCGRAKSQPLPESFQPLHYFSTLCTAYPNAFVSFVSIPGAGSWIGASPEVLIHVSRDKIFRTMALAGTQPASAVQKPSEAVWRQKEIEEQALVSRYIINCFKKIRLREFDELGPRTVAAGNLMHLRTDFSVDMKATDFPQLGSTMLELLHPTSAVCGMPRAEAKAFLAEKEQLNRQFFAGFLGPVNIQDEIQLFVNLRCMQLLEKEVVLYAGAGITGDSVPEKEWQETEHKIGTLASLLGN